MRFLLALAFGGALVATAAEIKTIAGNGQAGFSGDGGAAASAQLNNPYGLRIGPDGAMYLCEIGNHRIRRVDLKTGKISTFAGTGEKGYSGDGGPATQARMNEPYEVVFDRGGNLFFTDMQVHAIRRIDRKTGIITTVAGTGEPGFSGDGGPATKAQLRQPHSIAIAPDGGLLICDIGNNRIRRVDLQSGTMTTFAGTGEKKPTPDGAPLEGTPLNGPRALDVDDHGNLWLVLREGNAIYRIDPKANKIYHAAGTGEKGYTGDGGDAKVAKFNGPKGISWSPKGIFIADTENHVIRKLDEKTGVITSVAGSGTRGDGPDGNDPLKCQLARPHGILATRDGTVYIDDSENHRLRRLK
ncbi:MAG TPA: SMP-30/gluconolactonase/LRE family protein [Bryobacteraceae bacterium]|jgi:streptogramin lyase